MPAIDLDLAIETTARKTIAKIFSEKGEEAFRLLEKKVLRRINDEQAIVATGGGTPCFHQNMEWMNANGFTIYLKTEPQLLFDRLRKLKTGRPLISHLNDKELKKFVAEKLEEREPHYAQAHLVVPMHSFSLENIIEELPGKLFS